MWWEFFCFLTKLKYSRIQKNDKNFFSILMLGWVSMKAIVEFKNNCGARRNCQEVFKSFFFCLRKTFLYRKSFSVYLWFVSNISWVFLKSFTFDLVVNGKLERFCLLLKVFLLFGAFIKTQLRNFFFCLKGFPIFFNSIIVLNQL